MVNFDYLMKVVGRNNATVVIVRAANTYIIRVSNNIIVVIIEANIY